MTEPTEKQIKAGNYPKGHVYAHGMRISIETPADEFRSGTDKEGNEWSNRMQYDYGYIRGTEGNDGDHLDVFLGPDYKDHQFPVHVIDQHDPDTGKFDEHKVMMGFPDKKSALDAYHAHYPEDWKGAKAITPLHVDDFKDWALKPGIRKKPLSQVKGYAEGGSVGGFLADPQSWDDMGKNLGATANRTLIGLAGLGPDVINWGLKQIPRSRSLSDVVKGNTDLGWGSSEPIGGTDWLNRKAREHGIATSSGNETADAWGDAAFGLATASPTALMNTLGKGARGVARGVGQAIDQGMQGEGALSKVLAPVQPAYAVKPKGGNWSTTLGSNPSHLTFHDITGDSVATNQWRDKTLAKYISTQLGTADDPLLALEKEGRLHVDKDQLIESAMDGRYGEAYGYDGDLFKGDARHEELTGRKLRTPWEANADSSMRSHGPQTEIQALKDLAHKRPADGRSWIDHGAEVDPDTGEVLYHELPLKAWSEAHPGNAYLAKHQWLESAPRGTDIWNVTSLDNLGFQHMLDYLGSATDAHAALEHHGSIEAMRTAAQGALPNAAIHDLIPMVERNLHLSPEQLSRTSVADASAKTSEWNKLLSSRKATETSAQVPTFREYENGSYWKSIPDVNTDKDALSYAMAHGRDAGWCTMQNGLCSLYGSGGSRLHILHDAEGKPKVQIMTKEGDSTMEGASQMFHQAHGRFPGSVNELDEWAGENGIRINDSTEPGNPSIAEIKGRRNGSPDASDIPAIQDFIKTYSPNWDDIGDLRNSGMAKYQGKYAPIREVETLLKPRIKEARDFLDNHPAFESHRQAEKDFLDFLHSGNSRYDEQGTAQMRHLERGAGQPLHQNMPYTMREMKAMLDYPADWVNGRDESKYDVLQKHLGRIDALKSLVQDGAHRDVHTYPPKFASGGTVGGNNLQIAPLGGWGWGYMNSGQPGTMPAPQPVQAPDFSIEKFNPGGNSTSIINPGGDHTDFSSGARGADTGIAGGIGKIASMTGAFNTIARDPNLGALSSYAGAIAGAADGQYGGVGGLIGRAATDGNPIGKLAGTLLGGLVSDTPMSTRDAMSTAVGFVPGIGTAYSLGNFVTGGALADAAFGSNVKPTESGGYVPAQPGWFGNFGLQSTPKIDASNLAASMNNPDYSNEVHLAITQPNTVNTNNMDNEKPAAPVAPAPAQSDYSNEGRNYGGPGGNSGAATGGNNGDASGGGDRGTRGGF
jgi:hypothetical protein